MPESKDAELEKELRERFKSTKPYILLHKVEVMSNSKERLKVRDAIEATFQDYKKAQLEIRKLKEK